MMLVLPVWVVIEHQSERSLAVPGGSSMFADANGYQAAVQDVLDLLILHPRDFRARLNWIEFSDLYVLRAHETSARIAFLSVPPDRVFVTFPTQRGSVLFAGGSVLPFGDILLHHPGDRSHQRTTGSCDWGYVSLSPDSLSEFGRTITGQELVPPRRNRTLRPSLGDRQRLLRLHAQAGRVAEANLTFSGRQEVLHGLEQDLISALMSCLTNGEPKADRATLHHQAAVLRRFEALLAEQPHGQMHVGDMCNKIGVSEGSLRSACTDLLGMSPGRYQRLRQLKSLHGELAHADLKPDHGVEIIKRYGFIDLGSFIAEYWRTYGELPALPPHTGRTR